MALYIHQAPHEGTPWNLLAFKRQEDVGGKSKPRAYALIVAQPGGDGVIYYMTTRKKYRNQGYMKAIVEKAKQQCTTLRTQMSASTQQAIDVLTHLGFEKRGDWIVWKKPETTRTTLSKSSTKT